MASTTLSFASSSLSATARLPHKQNPPSISLSKLNLGFPSPSLSPSSLSLQRLSLSPLTSQRPAFSIPKASESEAPVIESEAPPLESEPESPGSELATVVEGETPAPAPVREEIFAVVMIGSRQYIVIPGRWINTQKLKGASANDKIVLNKVLLVGTRNTTYVGKPIVTNAAVHAVVEEQLLDKKKIVFKYKKKKNYRRNIGHRQPITRIRITGITGYEDYPASTLDS